MQREPEGGGTRAHHARTVFTVEASKPIGVPPDEAGKGARGVYEWDSRLGVDLSNQKRSKGAGL